MNEQIFLTALLDLSTSKGKDVSLVDKQFKKALLAFGSETEDNMSCVEEIEYVELIGHNSEIGRGLMLKTSGIPLPDVLHFAEGCPIPDAVKEKFPEISQKEWDAVLRLAVLILCATDS